MRTYLLLTLALLALVILAYGCGPSPSQQGSLTSGMCSSCGSAQLDIESQVERSTFDGSEVEMLTITCRDCGASWRAPTNAEFTD